MERCSRGSGGVPEHPGNEGAAAARILALPGVVSAGIGGDAQGREVIVIGLDRAHPETQARLPAELEGYRVQVQVIGAVKAQ